MPDKENNNSENNQIPEENPFTSIITADPLTSDRFNHSFDPSKLKDKKTDNIL